MKSSGVDQQVDPVPTLSGIKIISKYKLEYAIPHKIMQ